MLSLSNLLYENLKNPDSRTLVFCKSSYHTRKVIDELELENLLDSCMHKYNPRDLQIKSDNGAIVVFRYGKSYEELRHMLGCSFTNIIVVDYQETDSSVIGFLKSRLRTYQDIEVNAYGSNSKEFYGFVKLKWF